ARAARGPAARGPRLLFRAHRAHGRGPPHGADARGELRARDRDPEGEGRRRGPPPHERHPLRAHRRRVLPGPRPRDADPLRRPLGIGVLELLRSREPTPALVGPRRLRDRRDPRPRRDPGLRAAQGLAPAHRAGLVPALPWQGGVLRSGPWRRSSPGPSRGTTPLPAASAATSTRTTRQRTTPRSAG